MLRRLLCLSCTLVVLSACDSAPPVDASMDAGADGSFPDSGPPDAGADGGASDEERELGASCASGVECASGFCTDGVCCDAACDGACASCRGANTGEGDGACSAVTDGRSCRAATGGCDAAEACDGVSTECPTDGFLSTETECRSAVGLCDVAEVCDGTGPACPPDAVNGAGTQCRAAAGGCDIAELCDGVSAMCPADPAPLAVSVSFVDASCAGSMDGSASAVPSGGSPPYMFAWDGGETTESITGLGDGSYTTTVTDANGCTASQTVFLLAPPPLSVTFRHEAGTCGGDDGEITATPGGGTPIYSLAWDDGSTTNTITGLSPRRYDVTVTDLNGCTLVDSFELPDPCAVVPKIVFASSVGFTSNLGGLAGADSECATLASTAGLTGTFAAWLSDSGSSAATRLTQATVPYVRIDGVRVADDWDDLVDGTLDAPISVDENGVTLATNATAWTNTDVSGTNITAGSNACNDWGATASPPPRGALGSVSGTGSGWTHFTTVACPGLRRRLYCVEQ
ncbi:MAG: hypothetical protein AB8I08_16145 [Sandaracinaceae bacterium]